MMNDLNIKICDLLKNIDYEVLSGKVNDDLICFVTNNDKELNDELNNKTCFLCITGARFDSHEIVNDLIKKNVRLIIIEKNIDSIDIKNSNTTIVKVSDTKKTLPIIAKTFYKNASDDLKIIGITGTKGKTTTSFMIKNILDMNGFNTAVIGTIGCIYNDKKIETNNTTPDSLILHKLFYEMKKDGVEYVVMEVSSQSYKLHRVDGIKFDYSLWNNITKDHIGENEHKDFEEYFNCKLKIFENTKIKTFVFSKTDRYNDIINTCKKLNLNFVSVPENVVDKQLINDIDFLGIKFKLSNFDKYIFMGMIGEHNIKNACMAIAVAKELKISDEIILKSLSAVKVPGRVEVVEKNDDLTVLIDYAHNGIATNELIKTIREYDFKRVVIVFGCGGNRAKDRRYGMGEAVGKNADFAVITADNSRFEKTSDIIEDILTTLKKYNDNYVIIEDRREAIKYAIANHNKNDIVCIIGKGHEDYNEVNGMKTHFSDREEILKSLGKM